MPRLGRASWARVASLTSLGWLTASFIAPASSFAGDATPRLAPLLAQGESPGFTGFLVPIILMYVVIYFLILRPQRKQQREHQLMLNDLKKGDEIQITGGILGEVVSVDVEKERVEVRIDARNNTRVMVVRSAVVSILNREGPEDAKAAS